MTALGDVNVYYTSPDILMDFKNNSSLISASHFKQDIPHQKMLVNLRL